MSKDAARREVRRAVEAQGSRGEFADRAGIDPGTLGDFLDGKRWAQPRNRTKIEQALGWPVGRIVDLAEGMASEPAEDVIAAIEADPRLLPEAKEHLVKQYGLLLRVQGAASSKPLAPVTERTSTGHVVQRQETEDGQTVHTVSGEPVTAAQAEIIAHKGVAHIEQRRSRKKKTGG